MFFVLRGPAGAGKTIALKRAAFDAATANDVLVVWLEESGQLRPDIIHEIWDLTQRPIYLFVDQVALHVEKLLPFLTAMKARRVPLVLIGAEREADWTTYCGSLEEILPPHFLRVGHLSSAEVENLLDLLERHGCLGELRGKARSEQIKAFMNEEQADRQLLVALHVLTKGLPFEKIVLNEYESVRPEQARRLYLDIATMNQFAVPVRAGTISRASGIHFHEYKQKFFEPLKGMVTDAPDSYTGEYAYKTRHARVAQILFRQVCDDDVSRVAQFIRLIDGFDVGYSSDGRALEGICRGRSLTESFNDPAGVREIYQAAVSVAPRQAYLYQQWAIFESTHPSGDLIQAEKLAETASSMEPRNPVFVHTQAEVARKRANRESSPVLKEQQRRRTRLFLKEMSGTDQFAVSTRCKLLVDEVADLSDGLGEDERASEDRFFAEKLKETEIALAQAQQAFPDEAGLFEAEARLWSEMKDNVAGPQDSRTSLEESAKRHGNGYPDRQNLCCCGSRGRSVRGSERGTGPRNLRTRPHTLRWRCICLERILPTPPGLRIILSAVSAATTRTSKLDTHWHSSFLPRVRSTEQSRSLTTYTSAPPKGSAVSRPNTTR